MIDLTMLTDLVYLSWRCIVKRLILLLLLIVIFLPVSVSGQKAISFDRLVVELWPEYDEPSVLVIYRGILSSQVQFPVQITLTIPSAAGQPNAVAVRGPEGRLMSIQYERVVKGNWAEVTFTATSQEIQFEYYDPRLEKDDSTRSFVYEWPGEHAVNSAVFQIQRPRGASNLEISPSFGETFQGSDGLTYFRSEETKLAVGQKRVIHVSYNKDSDMLSIGAQPVQSSTAVEPKPSYSLQDMNLTPWVLAGGGVILIAVVVGLYLRFGTQIKQEKSIAGEKTEEGTVISNQQAYCPKCGSRTGESDLFCRVCGQKL